MPIIGVFALIAMGFIIPKIITTIGDSQSFVKTTDYLILSDYYAEKGQFMKSAEYLMKYRELENNLPAPLSDSLNNRINRLKLKEIQGIK